MGCRLPFLVVVGVILGVSVTLSTIPLPDGRENNCGEKKSTSEVIEIFRPAAPAGIPGGILGPAQSFLARG